MTDKIRNLGPVSMEWLNAVGVFTLDDLKRQGAVSVYQKAKDKRFNVSLNLLYAMEAAVRDIDWRALPLALKQELKDKVQ
ncbi:MAG: TfoX/Sxy family protein [Candidatus Omnitrophica bacterium]|nr:TfoX/Sxy family protein [Candidatus Omnitrophota bacterium]